jgi:dimethylhistidine N-methyltransferase
MPALAKKAARISEFESISFAEDVVAGLAAQPKWLLAKYFYDTAGSELFEQITDQPEYYPTRRELNILNEYAGAISKLIPPGAALIEFGAGSTKKARIVIAAAPQLAAYVPVDISGEFLLEEARQLRGDLPKLSVWPVAADFTQAFRLPAFVASRAHVGFFPGSTLGNFEPHDAAAFLRHAGRMLGKGSVLILGVDLVKATEVLNAAYNDAAGITAAFNRNLLRRMNRELDADFDLDTFSHRAFFNPGQSRIEMHLVSARQQSVTVAGRRFTFEAGESIHTESSYKYTLDNFRALAREAGWRPLEAWTDADGYFSVHALRYGG